MRKSRMAVLTVGVGLLVAGLLAPPSSAATDPTRVTINLTAVVVTVDNFPGIEMGDVITGSYTYNPKAKDINPIAADGAYVYNQQPYGMRLNIGSFTVETDPEKVDFQIGIGNDSGGSDAYRVFSLNNTAAVDTIDWQLIDPTQTALSNANLKKTAPVLSAWEFNQLEVAGEDDAFRIRAQVTQAVKVT